MGIDGAPSYFTLFDALYDGKVLTATGDSVLPSHDTSGHHYTHPHEQTPATPAPPQLANNSIRLQRPQGPTRNPSSTYAPIRHPVSATASLGGTRRERSGSQTRTRNRDPNAQYAAQEKAYVQRMRQAPTTDYFNDGGSAPFWQHDIEDDTPAGESEYNDGYPDDIPLATFGQDHLEPTLEELKIPENRERLEWHAMLSSVLKGDVVKQEKKRIGSTEERGGEKYKQDLWIGVKAMVHGRKFEVQKRVVDEGRVDIDGIIDEICHFEIHGRDKTDDSPKDQVEQILIRWEKCENLFATTKEMAKEKPKTATAEFTESYNAIVSWWNVTNLINTQLRILENWVGNEELDFLKRNTDPESGLEVSFLDRILKEDGLKTLANDKQTLLMGIDSVVTKAKETFISNREAFQKRHLPLFIEELLTLINFPTRLIEEVINIRLQYARKMKDPTFVIVETTLKQLHIVLELATQIKRQYFATWSPEPGWELPPCIGENFEKNLMDALRFYFKLLNWLVQHNRPATSFEGADLLEKEWVFANRVGQDIDEGDVLVAEQFSGLTSKLLNKLMLFFKSELQRTPEKTGAEYSKRFKAMLDTIRVGQRRLFRFARELSQRFENSTEYLMHEDRMGEFIEALIVSNHILLLMKDPEQQEDGLIFIASPSLEHESPQTIESIVRASVHRQEQFSHGTENQAYVLIISHEGPIKWNGQHVEMEMRAPLKLNMKPDRVRLVSSGFLDKLGAARDNFANLTQMDLDVAVERKANLASVDSELFKIKRTTYKLSNAIMDSIPTIRKHARPLGCQELVQISFAFAKEFGARSAEFLDITRQISNTLRLTKLSIDWVSFICEDCIPSNRQTFKWAVTALENAMDLTKGQLILSITSEDYAKLRSMVAGCMSLLISHFDIMGARGSFAAQADKTGIGRELEIEDLRGDEESRAFTSAKWVAQLEAIDELRKAKEAERRTLGKVLDDKNGMDKSLSILTSSFSNVTLRWQQGQFLGGGSFGTVHAAINLDTGGIMAVKEIRLQDPQMTPQIAQSIKDEMRVLEVLDHPNVVDYIGIEVHRDKVYLFMEYCGGGSLASLLEHGRIEDETVLQIYTLQMLEGLAYLHASNVVHRDIKPENILLDSNGVIKFVDFGAAKVIARSGKTRAFTRQPTRASVTRTGVNSMTGTPMYMSPEAITGTTRESYSAMDIWSLGCVILEAATGRKPWVNLDNEWAIMWNIAGGQKPQLPTPDQLSPAGIDFLNRCFEREPTKRGTAAELLQHDWVSEGFISGGVEGVKDVMREVKEERRRTVGLAAGRPFEGSESESDCHDCSGEHDHDLLASPCGRCW
ncbi:hypothetical protein BJ508DRAFT_208424 [Ascobolus immersus RN42]|uniref:mitogen-activated protein kinase n=1 Tax=Ascobolus immersus RN42 TaxID=1160509 RepID=A0A3N4I9N5_ASCIM|nr:hypothetical protein BJ508DRAFT_208424 [Ascobolus immersus RN42]